MTNATEILAAIFGEPDHTRRQMDLADKLAFQLSAEDLPTGRAVESLLIAAHLLAFASAKPGRDFEFMMQIVEDSFVVAQDIFAESLLGATKIPLADGPLGERASTYFLASKALLGMGQPEIAKVSPAQIAAYIDGPLKTKLKATAANRKAVADAIREGAAATTN